jgi:MFS family permease
MTPPAPASSAPGNTALKLTLLASMYLCQAIPLGYVFGSLPVIMRQQHMSLKSIGLLFVLHLPWALKFLHASWVDRTWLPALGRRRTWIFPLQWLGACLLLLAGGFPPETRFPAMFATLLGLNVVMATNDIAVDGYATDMLAPHERAWGNTVQASARYVGMMLGGGLMLFLHSTMGWAFLCRTLAAAVLVLSLPVVLHREIAPRRSGQGTDITRGGALAFLRQGEVLRLLVVLVAPTAFAFSCFQMRPPLLVDLGLDSRTMGELLMRYAYPAGLAGTVASGWLLHRLGPRVFLRAFGAVVVAAALYAAACARAGRIEPLHAALLLGLDNMLMGGVTVWGYTLMMHACAGTHSGTGFAVLSSLFILVPLALAPACGALGDALGLGTLYIGFAVLCLAGLAAAESVLRRGPAAALPVPPPPRKAEAWRP